MVGDLHTAALISTEGSIDWLCLPRFDSPACFNALVDTPESGRWLLAPEGGGECTRRHYRKGTLILETEWETPTGKVRVIDFMPPRDAVADIVRIVVGIRGAVRMHGELTLRFDYGHIIPWVRHDKHGIHAVAGPDAAYLVTDAPLRGERMRTLSDFVVREGDRVPFVLTYRPSHESEPKSAEPERALQDTEDYWRKWIGQATKAPDDEAVRRSLIVLKALTYAPTGGIVAAATTSLPEQLGGARNWDYRYCWLRDATFVLEALLAAGYVNEAQAWRGWLLRAIAGSPDELQIMYGLDGRRRLPEATLDWLDGYEGSRPVRTGNAAAQQFQLDVWGEVLDALHLSRQAGIASQDAAWDLQLALIGFLEQHWADPDNGLWEVRGPLRHFVHSKVMAWVGMDRAVQAVERFGLDGPVDRWRTVRQEIHDEVCTKGFDTDRGTFTQFYGSEGLDAALLLIPRVGFLPWDDPRVVGTIDAVQKDLLRDGFLLRYDTAADGNVDGLGGEEATFIACTFWLVDALGGIGRTSEARELFDRLLRLRNDVGLLSEEYDVTAQRQLGNTPQAYSHVGLINAATRLDAAGTPRDKKGKGTS